VNGEHCLKLSNHLVLTFVCQWDSHEDLRFMQRRALRFLFLCDLRIILPDGGLGVEDHQKGMRVISFCGVGAK
jgi:hypothetical protein